MEAIGIGDLHFDGGLSKLVSNHETVIVKEVQKTLNWGRKRGITNAILYGDICSHPRMSYESHQALLGLLRDNQDFMFYGILGNHDMFGKDLEGGHSMELVKSIEAPNFRLFTKPKTIKIDGARVRFLPWPHESFDPEALNILHKEVKGSKGDSGRVMDSSKLSVSDAVSVSGHLHTNQRVRNTFYSGTLYQTNFGESKEKFFHHISFTSPDDYEIINIPCSPEFVLYNHHVDSKADLKRIPKQENALVKLIVSDGADVNSSMWAHLDQVVDYNMFKSKEALMESVNASLNGAGEDVIVDPEDFFQAWMNNQKLDSDKKDRMTKTRSKILAGHYG